MISEVGILDNDPPMPIVIAMPLHTLLGRSTTALAAILICIFAAQGPMQNLVLCLGVDGHVAVEASAGAEGSCSDVTAFQTVAPGHCGVCRDVALTSTEFTAIPPIFAPVQGAPLGSLLPVTAFLRPTPFGVQQARCSGPAKQQALLSVPLHLSSTLLLI